MFFPREDGRLEGEKERLHTPVSMNHQRPARSGAVVRNHPLRNKKKKNKSFYGEIVLPFLFTLY